MKQVFSNSEICHFWAHNSQPFGRTSGGSMYFEGNKFFSYGNHFCLAHRLPTGEILFNSRSYSVTTSKHQSILRSALSGKTLVFCPYPDKLETRGPVFGLENYNENFEYWFKQCKGLVSKLEKARNKSKYLTVLQQIGTQITEFCKVTGIEADKTLLDLVNISTTEQAKEILKSNEKRIQDAIEKKREREKAEYMENVDKFTRYEISRIYSRPSDVFDYIRVSKDGTEIETTQGVKMPITEAKTYLNLITSTDCKVGTDIGGYDFRGYRLNRSQVDIGCHRFEIDHLNTVLNN